MYSRIKGQSMDSNSPVNVNRKGSKVWVQCWNLVQLPLYHNLDTVVSKGFSYVAMLCQRMQNMCLQWR